jgi:catechol 2,3-dioxygenase-like lactoylglutathione lyase family enzyme
MDYRLEVANIPVSDVDQAKQFYQGLGWRLDADFDLGGGTRIVQMTPPGSACSVSFGTKIPMAPELVVDDIEAARAELTNSGVEVSEPFHREGAQMRPGVDPKHQSYASYASFKDPAGNAWTLQEVTERLPGRSTSPLAVYGSEEHLAQALQRASDAYTAHEAKTGQKDANWSQWYAHFMTEDPNA